EQVVAVAGLAQWFCALDKLGVGEESLSPGDLFGGADLVALAGLQRADEVRGVVEGVEGAGVQPGGAAGEDLDLQLALLQVATVEVGDLQLAADRGAQLAGVADDPLVVEVQTGHCV